MVIFNKDVEYLKEANFNNELDKEAEVICIIGA
jgi:hypothetical protein